jgi:hypothetical protein
VDAAGAQVICFAKSLTVVPRQKNFFASEQLKANHSRLDPAYG